MRLKLFPVKFWVIDMELDNKCDGLKFDKLAKMISPTVL